MNRLRETLEDMIVGVTRLKKRPMEVKTPVMIFE